MAGQSLVAREAPRAVGQEAYGQHHLHHVLAAGEEVARLVEQAVAQARAYEYADEAVDEERVKQFGLDFLLLVQPLHYEECRQQPQQPAQRVPAQAEASEVEGHEVGVPVDVE